MRATDIDLIRHRVRERLKEHEDEADLSPSDGAEIAIEELERLMRDAGTTVERSYGDWMVPGLWYRALRKVVLRRTGRRLTKYPEPLWPFGALGRAWRRWFGRTRLSLYTTPTIGVIGRKVGRPA